MPTMKALNLMIPSAPPQSANAEVTRRQLLVIGAGAAATAAMPFAASAASPVPNGATTSQGTSPMNYVTTKDGVQIFYKDWGPTNATPIVFSHGWPLSSDDWDCLLYTSDAAD